MTNDDKFEEALTAMAREHNRPPAVPREEMWAVIAATRAAERGKESAPAPVVIPMRRPRTVWRWTAVGSALAATLLLGIVIGRRTRTEGTKPAASDVVATRTREASMPTAAMPNGSGSSTTTGTSRAADNVGSQGGSGGSEPQRPVERRSGSTMVASATTGSSRGSSPGTTSRDRDAALPYRVAALQHLATTEALLVSLRSDARAGRSDTTIAGWAGQLLGTTRMLIDSPASKDPQMKQLLQDLELVLAQIARLPEAHGQAADLGLIDDAVQRRQIMTRLRALTPIT